MERLDIAICVPHTATRIHRTETMLARKFSELGHRVQVVVFEVAELERRPRGYVSHDGIEFFFIRGARLAESIYFPLEGAKVEGLRLPDVVHVTEDTQSITYWADAFARREGRPLCVTTNRDRLPGAAGRRALYRNAERLFGRRVREEAAAFSVHTPGQLEYLRARGLRREDVDVIPNMVDTARFRPTQERSGNDCMRFAGAGLSLLSVGRLTPNKGYPALLRAFSRVASERPDARLTIIGKGAQEAYLRDLIAQLALSDRVLLHTGFVENMELAIVYPHFDAYVQPSFVEPFGIAVLEAMACGLPVVASSTGGMRYSVVDGESGVLAAPGDEIGLARAMLAVGDEAKRRRMGACALARARDVYDWNKIGAQYLDFYARALAKPGPWRVALARAPKGATSPSLRVAIAVATLGIGRGRNEVALSRFLEGRGHRPVIVTCWIEGAQENSPGWHEVAGVPVLILPSLRLGGGIFLPVGGRKAIRRDWVDLLHVTEDTQGVTWWAARAARRAGRPLAISTERYASPSTLVSRIAYAAAEFVFARRLRREADAFAVRSGAVVRWLERRPGYLARDVLRIPNAVDAKVYRPDASPSRLKGSAGRPSILSVGRLVENKDFATLIRAMTKVRGRLPDAQATILGRGPLESDLRGVIAIEGLEGAVHLETSFVPDEAFPGTYSAFTIYAQPSRVEPMALSALEAMASGLPLIASAVGGMTEVVRDGENGFLHRPGDADALADAIVKAADPATHAKLAEGARRIALAEFDWQVVGEEWLDFYDRAMKARLRRAAPEPSLAPEGSLS